jgi:hypothetical protein
MTKKYIVAGAMAAFMAAASLAQAPVKNISYSKPTIEKSIVIENALEKIVRKSEKEFLKSLYSEFPYSEEIPDIIKHAKIFGLEPELLMAIRLAENGSNSLAYGVMHNGRIKERYENDKGYVDKGVFYPYQDEKEKQLHWAAQTVRFYLDQFEKNPKNKDFISYLAKIYAPVGALNDPNGLNKYWEGNVKRYYKAIKK